jgi:hypothetical protein
VAIRLALVYESTNQVIVMKFGIGITPSLGRIR